MKHTTKKSVFVLLIAALSFASCSKDKTETVTPETPATVTVKNDIDASAGIVYYNLTTGTVVDAADAATTKWDVAFTGTNNMPVITANKTSGSAQIVASAFDDVKEAPADGYQAAGTALADFQTWATYTAMTAPMHAVLAKTDATIVIKTPDGKYAKLQVINFYSGHPDTTTPEFANLQTRPKFGFYSIRYAIQTSGSRKF
ncbi:hypothetical protein D0C36_03585 [Mucilaginibacter conchicola]|uniref:HmuY protein n=1 Tax=Mucilaginibacter conchicola TaxID=2303333 RepID=A0A372NX00_9SPHI|nr:HmuY family protein [Mucilaginibacter conchicola]RFZ94636.1 hypothetical protein D0C36_03585 [Mucilaginibacter conchicola]